jgi:hypothetical protein
MKKKPFCWCGVRVSHGYFIAELRTLHLLYCRKFHFLLYLNLLIKPASPISASQRFSGCQLNAVEVAKASFLSELPLQPSTV